jgi:predicted patatin/cPLA2 family phospholipase
MKSLRNYCMTSYTKQVKYFFFLLCLISFIFSKSGEKKCRVLALQGGGDKGSYQAGAMQGLFSKLPPEEVAYDVVTGISVGALNAAGLALFQPGDEKSALEFILGTWRGFKSWHDVYKRWPLSVLSGFINKSSFYNTSPMKKLLTSKVQGKKIMRKIVVGSVDLITGKYQTWDERNMMNYQQIVERIMCSSAFPGFFPYVDEGYAHYTDGGINVGVDLISGINRCKEMGFKDEEIILDTILCSTSHIPEKEKNLKAPQVLARIVEIVHYNNSMRDLMDALRFYPNVNFRYLVSPEKHLPSGSLPIQFDPKKLEEMIQIGIVDGEKTVKDGEGTNYKKLLGYSPHPLLHNQGELKFLN